MERVKPQLFDKVPTLYLIDGTAMFWRFYSAPFQNLGISCPDCLGVRCGRCGGSGREPTKAVFAFIRFLIQLIKLRNPDYLCVCFDGERANLHRRKIYPAYKSNRDKPGVERPTDVQPQLNRIKQILRAMGITTVQCNGFESDDALATLATQHANENLEAVIVARDKDMRVLCRNPNIFCFDPMADKWHSDKTAGLSFGVKTEQLSDYLALVGDAVDCIPGVQGWGEVTTVKYLKRYSGVADLLSAARAGLLPVKLAANLLKANANGMLEMSQRLIELVKDVPNLPLLEDLKTPKLEPHRVEKLFKMLNFNSLL